MDERRSFAAALGLLALGVAASAATYPRLPARVAIHWSAADEPNGSVAKQLGAFLAPATGLLVLGVLAPVPRIDPLGGNVAAFREQYDAFVVVLAGFLLAVHLLVLAPNLG